LEFFALFAQRFHVEVTVGFDPVLVDLDGEEGIRKFVCGS
jgi:hypothetical protein